MPRIGVAACALLAALALGFTRCALPFRGSGSVTILSWNLQTLFDDRDDGLEFAGWSVAGGEWDADGYRARLRSFAAAIASSVPGGPEVVVLQEVENQRVATDLAELLPGSWPTRVLAGGGGALGIAVLSRFQLVEARAHAAGAVPGFRPEELRPLLEAVLDADGIRLTVLAAHWKSKVEGAEATEPARRAQAAVAARRIAEILEEDPGAEVLLAGDLNENPDEWRRTGGAWPTALLPADLAVRYGGWRDRILLATEPEGAGRTESGLALWSPWDETEGFSYVWQGREERIDHVLLAPGLLDGRGLSYLAFTAHPLPGTLEADGTPNAWCSRSRDGYSDHLPIRLELTRP
ncbi:MAG TPA: endonuclease/exonuclease/phosphatase family protein [Magnetospirillaceae bacterium]|nr:endonuclease/exonuclease/phosphatase family protein [Magnetospirillaceae bacterium]